MPTLISNQGPSGASPRTEVDAIPGSRRPHLFCFGLGYSAGVLARRLRGEGWLVSGTCRRESDRQALAACSVRAYRFDRDHPLEDAGAALSGATDVLISVPPDARGDVVYDRHGEDIAALRGLRWVGYLSTTGVYGDTCGLEVDEGAPLRPTSDRSRRRVEAERLWLELVGSRGLPVHVFRLAGIYGPGRSVLDQVRAGAARRIDRPGQAFSRIHVDDIASILRASMAHPVPGRIYNVCDDEPAKQSDVVAFACELLGVSPPPLLPLEEAEREMSPMALSFWRDNRRVSNGRIKRDLGIRLRYPDYRAGLRAILEAERDEGSATTLRP